MMIEQYSFGSITINGINYNYDVEVRWPAKEEARQDSGGRAGEVLKWWRKESHIFDSDDLKRAIEQNPHTIILGTGAYGAAQVTDRAKQEIESRGIKLIIDKTGEAVKAFNIIQKKLAQEKGEHKLIGLFHLTC